MNDKNIELDQKEDRLILTYDVSDEALESAAIGNGKVKNLTISFCSTPWTCPMKPFHGATG